MSYFEILRQGSPFHRVDRKSDRSIAIYPAEDGDDDWIRFQQVVAEAEQNAGDEYEVQRTCNICGICRAFLQGAPSTIWPSSR
jgi:hypothetical protein